MNASSTSPVRVLLLIKGLGLGGAERLLVSLAEVLKGTDVEVTVAYLLPSQNHLVDDLRSHGVTTVCLGGAGPRDVRWLGRLRRLVMDGGFDVLHAQSPLMAALARPVVRSVRKDRRPVTVSTEHAEWRSYHPLTRALNRLTFPLETATLAVSNAVRDGLPYRVRRRAETVVHGVAVEAIAARSADRDQIREALGVGPTTLLVGTIANLRVEKDYPTLLRAARRVEDRRLPVRFISVGHGPLESELRAQCEALGLSKTFSFLGYREDAVGVLAGCDVFCLCSTNEGLPIALLEALALGLPAIVTPVGGVPEVVSHDREALFVPVGDDAAIADAIERMNDEQVRRRMGHHARNRGADFSIGPAAKRHLTLYQGLAASRREGRAGRGRKRAPTIR